MLTIALYLGTGVRVRQDGGQADREDEWTVNCMKYTTVNDTFTVGGFIGTGGTLGLYLGIIQASVEIP